MVSVVLMMEVEDVGLERWQIFVENIDGRCRS